MKKILFILFSACCFLPLRANSQVSFTTTTDRLSISVSDLLQVQYLVENGEFDQFKPPVFRDFKVMEGPYESSGMSLVNSKLTKYKAVIYLLQPQKTGRLTVPGATALVNGKSMKSNNILIEVTKGAPQQQPISPPGPADNSFRETEQDYQLAPGEDAVEKIKKNLFVRLVVDKTTAYVGEPIVAEYKLYTRLRSESRVSKRPSLNGFSVYDMVDPSASNTTTETLNGKQYQVHTIRKTQLFPLQEGIFLLEPVEVENKVRFLRTNQNQSPGSRSNSPLDRMFDDLLNEQNGEWEEQSLTISSRSQSITVKPLPLNAPAGFYGAVGKFQLHGSLKNNSIPADETGNYELVIEGSGNIPLVNEPQWKLPAGFQLFEPELSDDINMEQAPMTGRKIISYSFSSSKQGNYVLPGMVFSYFDPSQNIYKSIRTDSIKLTVTAPLNRRKVSTIVKKDNSNLPAIVWIIGGILVLGGVTAGFVVSKNKKTGFAKITPTQEIPITPTEEAEMPVIIKDPLTPAKIAYTEGDHKVFYQSIEKALWDTISERLQLNSSAQQKPKVLEQLSRNGLNPVHIQYLKDCWGQSEWALYVPESGMTLDETLLEKASTVITAIEKLSVG